MTDQERKAMEMALEALEWSWGGEPLGTKEFEAMDALRQALAQGEHDHLSDAMSVLADVNADLITEAKLAQPDQKPHNCTLNSPYQAYGIAIEDCYEDDEGRFWAGNGEYGSQVNYCPVCGTKAPKQVDGDKHD